MMLKQRKRLDGLVSVEGVGGIPFLKQRKMLDGLVSVDGVGGIPFLGNPPP